MKKSKLLFIVIFVALNVFAQRNTYVLIISFDGFRWDYPNRGITPNIEQMINNGSSALSLRPVFPSKTFPNHLSIITGLYAENHGIISNDFINPFTNERYKIGDPKPVSDSRWYLGEAFWETAEKNGIKTASMFWPGSETELEYRRPSYTKNYEHNFPYKSRVDQVITWLELPEKERPHFITLYFHDTDSYGHVYGPNSPELNQSIIRLDSILGYLFSELEKINFRDSINIILTSDHGMTEINPQKTIKIDSILEGLDYQITASNPFALIQPKENNFEIIYKRLSENQTMYKCYKKKDLPEYFHYSSHPFISPIIVIANPGWSIKHNRSEEESYSHKNKGDHGYDNNFIDMHGILIADGPAFKDGYRTGTLWNIDIYPLLCKIFWIAQRDNINGKLERIEFILR